MGTVAFDLNVNAYLLLSGIRLAEAQSIPDDLIIRSSDDVDAFILGTAGATANQNGRQVEGGS